MAYASYQCVQGMHESCMECDCACHIPAPRPVVAALSEAEENELRRYYPRAFDQSRQVREDVERLFATLDAARQATREAEAKLDEWRVIYDASSKQLDEWIRDKGNENAQQLAARTAEVEALRR